MKEFIFGNFVYEYELLRQDRKSFSLTVQPNLNIVLKCPISASQEKIDHFLKKKWFWLEGQLIFFKKYHRKIYDREYISGESLLYLGYQYKLIVKEGNKDIVKLNKNTISVFTTRKTSNGGYNKKILDVWYKEMIDTVFKDRFEKMLKRFEYISVPRLEIREMKKRWGSFLNNTKILLNPKLIQTSVDCIDYVIIHELCHLKYKNHDKRFFNLLENKYPKWNKTKDKLELFNII